MYGSNPCGSKYMELSENGETPQIASPHPFIDGIFHEINHPAIGDPPFQEPPI